MNNVSRGRRQRTTRIADRVTVIVVFLYAAVYLAVFYNMSRERPKGMMMPEIWLGFFLHIFFIIGVYLALRFGLPVVIRSLKHITSGRNKGKLK